jgi:hypothetical protein
VEVGDAQAEAGGGLEAAGGSVHFYSGWGDGVDWGEYQRAPVLAVVIGGFGWAGENVMPSVVDT